MARHILTIIGTRPEAIKMAPVVLALRSCSALESRLCVTGQHRKMLDDVLDAFAIAPDADLNLMKVGQDPSQLMARALMAIHEELLAHRPDLVLVHGDTTTSLAAALAAFHARIPIAHVEAGLRTGRLTAPFPEEGNRLLTSRLTSLHFAPTPRARQNLIDEGVHASQIKVTGNTVVDALRIMLAKITASPVEAWRESLGSSAFEAIQSNKSRSILVTCHRRETFGVELESVCGAIRDIAVRHRDWHFLYPVHPNPQVRGPVHQILSGIENVHLLAPLSYAPFVWMMNRVDLIVTDSGGIQEEAPALGKPVLAMRKVTERAEAIEAGTARLIGTDPERIIVGVEETLSNDRVYRRMARVHDSFGDGRATERILGALTGADLPDFEPLSEHGET